MSIQASSSPAARMTLRRIILAGGVALSLVFGFTGSSWVLEALAAEGKDKETQPPRRPGEGEGAGQAPRIDTLTLTDGKMLKGTLLDVTADHVVLRTESGKEILERPRVQKIDRSAESKALDFVARYMARYEAEATPIADWKQLADFCRKHGLFPEQRACLRQVIRLAPDDAEARAALGEVLVDGRWLTEVEVEKKRREGFDFEKKESKEGPTVVVKKPVETPRSIIFLERQKLSEREMKRMEKERRERIEKTVQFRRKLESEYQGVDWSKRHRIQTRHFEIHCNSTYEVAQRYGVLMELIRGKLAEMFKGSSSRSQRAAVYIYASQEDFMNNDDYGRWAGRGLGGYYIPINQSITTYHGTFGFTGTTFGVLCHEGTHYYQGLLLKNGFDKVPIWFIEGLAVYFGDGSKFDPERKRITIGHIPRDRLGHIQEKMARGSHKKVEELVGMNRSNFWGSHYADAWALIYFLVQSGNAGKQLLAEYWAMGIDPSRREPLAKKDFLQLAVRHFGTVEELERQYVGYITNLRPPPAGVIQGDYFVSDDFQFEFKAPGPEWQFFDDLEDKNLLVGLLLPGTSAAVRLYYTNNMSNKKADEYFQDYLRAYARHLEGMSHEKVRSGNLDWYKLSYVDTGKRLGAIAIELDDDGGIIVVNTGEPDKAKEKQPRDVIKFMLIQIDGVASIECSVPKGEMDRFRSTFEKLNENFSLLFSRRW
jgi:hypothetical protein